jgi:hypothetical protein
MAAVRWCLDEGRKRAGRRFVRPVCLSLLAVLALAGFGHAGPEAGSVVNCAIQTGPCTRLLDGRRVTLDVQPKPVSAMTDLTFTVTIEGADEKTAAHIELNMPAMNMGKNLVALKRNEKGDFVGQGVIVRCRSGIRTWRAKVVVDDLGAAEFIFDVNY